MANAFATTRIARKKSTPDFPLHIFRRCYMHLLTCLDAAIAAERELEFAANDQIGGMFDDSISGYLRDAENKWDHVTDSLSALTASANSVPDIYDLRTLAFAMKSVLASETGADFAAELKAARHLIASTCVSPNASVVTKDFYQLLRATAGRLDDLESIGLYRRDVPEFHVDLH